MDQIEQEKKQRKLLEVKKTLERDLNEKKQIVYLLNKENKSLEAEERLLEIWLEKYVKEKFVKF